MQKIENDSAENIQKYSKFGLSGTSWLGFRDIAALIEQYVESPKRVLDYGCGVGRSTRFLKSLGLNPIGVDISVNALMQAENLDSEIPYILLESSRIPMVDDCFDFVFSSYVLLVMDSKNSILTILKEVVRVLKKNGTFILITGSEELHSRKRDWLSYDVNFPENESLKSGSLCKVQNKEIGAVFYDYHWTDQDYREMFEIAGLTFLHMHKPLGNFHEGYQWKSELLVSPHTIYILKK